MRKCSSKSDAFCSPGWNETSDVELLRAGTHCHARKLTATTESADACSTITQLALRCVVCEQRHASTRPSTIWTLVKSFVTTSLSMVKGSSRPAASILMRLAMPWAFLPACKFSSLISVRCGRSWLKALPCAGGGLKKRAFSLHLDLA